MEASEEQDSLQLASANFHRLYFTSTTFRLCLEAFTASMEACSDFTSSVEASILAPHAEINMRFQGRFYEWFHISFIEASTQVAHQHLFEASITCIGVCFAPMKAPRSLRRFRGSFCL